MLFMAAEGLAQDPKHPFTETPHSEIWYTWAMLLHHLPSTITLTPNPNIKLMTQKTEEMIPMNYLARRWHHNHKDKDTRKPFGGLYVKSQNPSTQRAEADRSVRSRPAPSTQRLHSENMSHRERKSQIMWYNLSAECILRKTTCKFLLSITEHGWVLWYLLTLKGIFPGLAPQ